ncbi:two-component sensor histidine kinase [Prolixibacter bellariivorans]|uniref:histidine kinase n=1 Tax=Prolixibacter bellariivorans TaxID=314319 RepID=A0A5M4AYA1_9BACT|nr:HAMP domain-containing sensor histidine kinase [Prolixibacter bellariivorans]GET32603.1 two-component sensor histidine kinase [Prolixibacter bellariivorans]
MFQFFSNRNFKGILLTFAFLISIGTFIYTKTLVDKLKQEEHRKVELWAQATHRLAESRNTTGEELAFTFDVVENNQTVPIIVTDQNDSILYDRNLEIADGPGKQEKLRQILVNMKKLYPPIVIPISPDKKNLVYYSNSNLLNKLRYYPLVQLLILTLFILVAYVAFSASRVSEQNRVWVGMAKETAHQLGTPISSLMAWVELLRMQNVDESIVTEIAKDTERLNRITERFSKIGSTPELTETNVVSVLANAIEYLEKRSPKRILFTSNFNPFQEIMIPLNVSLFSWVIENLCKNAIDAIEGKGEINVSLYVAPEELYIDVSDSGKGIPKSSFREVFRPGYTTKKRGWGLGLSLAKRIIENYHNGHISVKHSEINKGTTFRIVLHSEENLTEKITQPV